MSWSALGANLEAESSAEELRALVLQQEIRIEQLLRRVEVHRTNAEEVVKRRDVELEEEKAEVHRLKKEMERTQRCFDASRKEISVVATELEALREGLDVIRDKQKKLGEEKEVIHLAVHEAQEKTSRAETKIDETSNLLLASERASVRLSSENACVHERLKELEKRFQSLEEQKSCGDKMIAELQKDCRAERLRKSKIEEARDKIIADLDMMRRLVNDTKMENVLLKKQLASASISAGDALPKVHEPQGRNAELQGYNGLVKVTLTVCDEEISNGSPSQYMSKRARTNESRGPTMCVKSSSMTVEELFATLAKH